jgi:hypothetical protein
VLPQAQTVQHELIPQCRLPAITVAALLSLSPNSILAMQGLLESLRRVHDVVVSRMKDASLSGLSIDGSLAQ